MLSGTTQFDLTFDKPWVCNEMGKGARSLYPDTISRLYCGFSEAVLQLPFDKLTAFRRLTFDYSKRAN